MRQCPMRSSSFNRRLHLAFVIAGLVTSNVLAQGAGPAKADSLAIEKTMLAEGIYLFRAPSALDLWTSSNTVVVVNDSDVVVFDSNARVSTSRLVIAEIRQIPTTPVRPLLNSHWHIAHSSRNAAYDAACPA